MVDSFSIKNFRSFNDVKVDGCRRVNILVGDSGSGKTALLEALFLAAGVSPELAVRTRTLRGVDGSKLSGSNEEVNHALWGDLFYKFETSKLAVVSLKGKGEQTRSVTVRLTRRGHVRAIPPSRRQSGAPVKVVPDPAPIEFKWKIQGFPDVTVVPKVDKDGLTFPPIPDSYVKAIFFSATHATASIDVANRFSKLSCTFAEEKFIERFNWLYTNIKSLSVELNAGSAMLFAKVEGMPEKIPISLASGGMSKLAAILLGIRYTNLNDEPLVWKYMDRLDDEKEIAGLVATVGVKPDPPKNQPPAPN